CVLVEIIVQRKEVSHWKPFLLTLELYALALIGSALLPENIRPSINAGWIGLVVSRLTAITAVLGLCILVSLHPRKWHAVGFAIIAIVFFSFLYQDTGWLNHVESNARNTLATLPAGSRVIPAIDAPAESRITFIGHLADRACIGHCFTYSNYE